MRGIRREKPYQDMLVPLNVAVSVSLSIPALVICTPGAKTSTRLPMLLKLATRSLMSVAPTTIASFTRDGENREASTPSLPAARITCIPASIALRTASSRAREGLPPRERERREGRPCARACSVAKSIPEMMVLSEPAPSRLRTLMPWRRARLATPKCAPPTEPEQWVPSGG